MKRILSLTLVLVMVLGMIPMVSAAVEHSAHAGEAGTWKWVEDASAQGYQAPTCTKKGVMPLKCDVPGCNGTSTKEIPMAEHTIDAAASTTTIVAATCDTAGSKTGLCTVCNTNQTVTIPAIGGSCDMEDVESSITADCTTAGVKDQKCKKCGKVVEDIAVEALGHEIVNGKCTRCSAAVSAYNVSVTPSLTLKPGEKGTISITATPASGSGSVTVSSVNFVSKNTAVASVSANGEVTAVAKGTTAVDYSFEIGDESFTGSCSVTVDIGEITCNKVTVKVGDEATLSPSLSLTGVTPTWSYEIKSGSSVIDLTGAKITGKTPGTALVTVKASYTVGSTSNTITLDVPVSVYENLEVKAVLKETTSKAFDFADTGIWDSIVYNGTKLNTTTYSSLQSVLTEDYASSIVVTEASLQYGNIGTLTGGGSTTSSSVGLTRMDGIKFTLNGTAGSQMLYYTLYNSYGMIVAEGTLTISTDGFDAAVSFTTMLGTPVTIDESKFASYWNSCKMSGELDYVTFGVDNFTPYRGELYTTSTASTRKEVTSTMKFTYKYSSTTDDYDLDTVTYVPSYNSDAFKEEIPFTCYGVKSGEVVTGVMVISVGEKMNFTDVKTTDYFYDAVVWAVGEGITSGTSATTFSPNATCTRAQVVTFLYRAAGEPDVSGSVPFTDVKYTDYYYDAVLWAYKNDITTGLTATTFGPNSTVTRGQVVTFLCRALEGKSSSSYNPFTDVKSTDYFYDAVLWAVKNDVTTGLTATTFGPNSGCTRGQIVTFLYRAYEGE